MFSTIKRTTLSVGLILFGIGVMTCANKNDRKHPEEITIAAKTIEEVLNEHTRALMSLPGVIGTAQGICDGKPCIKVYVIEKTPELDQRIPNNLEGYAVVLEETGEIRTLPKNQE